MAPFVLWLHHLQHMASQVTPEKERARKTANGRSLEAKPLPPLPRTYVAILNCKDN